MHLIVLAVPDCTSVKLLNQRLALALEGRGDVTVSRHVVAGQDEAARWGMHGSPTILVDGIDPFAEPGQRASVSCRLYGIRGRRAEGAPSVRQLRQAITSPVTLVSGTGSGNWLDALSRGGQDRAALACRVASSQFDGGRPTRRDISGEASRISAARFPVPGPGSGCLR